MSGRGDWWVWSLAGTTGVDRAGNGATPPSHCRPTLSSSTLPSSCTGERGHCAVQRELSDTLCIPRFFLELTLEQLTAAQQRLVSEESECGVLALNCVVAAATTQPPLALPRPPRLQPRPEPRRLAVRQECLATLAALYGGQLPLRRATTQADPLLFADRVSAQRKRFRSFDPLLPGS